MRAKCLTVELYGPGRNQAHRNTLTTLVDLGWWSSEAFADVLSRAAAFDPRELVTTPATSLHALVYKSEMRSRMPCDLALLLRPKISKHFEKQSINYIDSELDFLLEDARQTF